VGRRAARCGPAAATSPSPHPHTCCALPLAAATPLAAPAAAAAAEAQGVAPRRGADARPPPRWPPAAAGAGEAAHWQLLRDPEASTAGLLGQLPPEVQVLAEVSGAGGPRGRGAGGLPTGALAAWAGPCRLKAGWPETARAQRIAADRGWRWQRAPGSS
jgi:hypothetical protein